MKKLIAVIVCLALCLGFFGCSKPQANVPDSTEPTGENTPQSAYEGTHIHLSDDGITVDGKAASADQGDAVYVANDIIYYEAGKDFTYGEGDKEDAHTKAQADAHSVVHITKAGQYVVSGTLSKGQLAVDLGENAKADPTAVVTLVLEGANITCSVAPAVIFYNVYECGSTDNPTATVDTAAAGANVILAANTESNIDGAYVAKIYKSDSVVLDEDGTEVEDAKKLHKYDGAFYSKMSMNIGGEGTLNIKATNEGLDSEMHLTINSGNINIISGNDGINTNEDNVSVTTINGGNVNILVDGSTGEGDGIDSNGWLVINGGTVTAQACGSSGDAGIDSDMGIHINGGTVLATGNMLDRISESAQNFAVFQFSTAQRVSMYADEFRTYTLKNSQDNEVLSHAVTNDFSYLIISSADLVAGEYTLWQGSKQLSGSRGGQMGMGGFGGMEPPPEVPEGMTPPEGMQQPEGAGTPPEGMQRPEGDKRPENEYGFVAEITHIFQIQEGGNYFTDIAQLGATRPA